MGIDRMKSWGICMESHIGLRWGRGSTASGARAAVSFFLNSIAAVEGNVRASVGTDFSPAGPERYCVMVVAFSRGGRKCYLHVCRIGAYLFAKEMRKVLQSLQKVKT